MLLNLEKKQQMVAQLHESFATAVSLVVADFQGVPVVDMTELRKRARETGVRVQVVRNKLARRALQDTEFVCMEEALTGPLLCAFSLEDPGAGARLFKEFGDTHPSFRIKNLAVSGRLMGGDQVDMLATLPTREEALARLAGTLQGPVAALMGCMQEVAAQLVRTLAAVAEQKGVSGAGQDEKSGAK